MSSSGVLLGRRPHAGPASARVLDRLVGAVPISGTGHPTGTGRSEAMTEFVQNIDAAKDLCDEPIAAGVPLDSDGWET